MLYYLGKGTECKKEECKEYKTLDGARKAFDKAVAAGAEATVWDEKGVVVIGMTENVPEGALQTNPDGSVNAYDADGNKVGTVDAATVAAVTGNTGAGDGQQDNTGTSTDNAGAATGSGNDDGRGNMPPEQENGQNGANTQPQESNEEHPAAGEEYQTPHPEGITSLCYSCTEYETCNVKTGTCTKCDQYKNRGEAYKTDEQRYSEEQDRIDKETAKKLREKADEERMNNLPSDTKENGQKVHHIKLGASFFEEVERGEKTFELRKNDRDYKKGDILEMMEFKDGRNTGRTVRVLVTYILTEFAGLEEGYCIMATCLLNENGEPLERANIKQICADIRANGDGYIEGGDEYIMIDKAVNMVKDRGVE